MSRKIVKLKDVATIRTGKLNANAMVENGEYPFFTCSTEPSRIDTYAFDCECVIVAGNGAVGHSQYFKGKFNAYQRTYVITCNETVLTKYLYYVFQNGFEDFAKSQALVGGVPYIKLSMLEDYEIPLPPLTEQQAVVEKLDLLTEYAMGISKGIPKEIELRQKQYEYYRDEWLSFNKEVAFLSLDKVAKIRNGKGYKNFNSGDIPVYGSGGIMSYIDNFAYDKPSVLIPRKGSLSKLYYLEKPFWTVDTLFYTEINADLIIPKYLFYYLQTLHLEELNQSGGVPSLTQSQLNILKIPLPSLTEQQGIVDKLDLLTDYITELNDILQAELKLRDKQYKYYLEQCINYSY